MHHRFFADAAELRDWLRRNHDRRQELWVAYRKKGTGIPSVDWPGSVDAALCFGWIDGIRKRIDETSYMVRFTPRRRRSRWSARNIGRMEALIADGLVEEAGLAAYEARDPAKDAAAAASLRHAALPAAYEERIKANPGAWEYYLAASRTYRKQVAAWVTSARKEATRLRRLDILVESSAAGRPVPPLRWSASAPSRRPGPGRR